MAISIEKECKYCGENFKTTNYRKKYCSSTCKTYASHQRTGKLNKSQRALLESQLMNIGEREVEVIRNDELIDLLTDHLRGLVSIGGRWSITTVDWLDYNIHPYEDDEVGLERVILTPKNNFIYRSYCKELVYRVKSLYSGANIFTTAGKLEKRAKPLTLACGRKDKITTTSNVVRHVVYNTLLSFNHVLDKSDIDYNLF